METHSAGLADGIQQMQIFLNYFNTAWSLNYSPNFAMELLVISR